MQNENYNVFLKCPTTNCQSNKCLQFSVNGFKCFKCEIENSCELRNQKVTCYRCENGHVFFTENPNSRYDMFSTGGNFGIKVPVFVNPPAKATLEVFTPLETLHFLHKNKLLIDKFYIRNINSNGDIDNGDIISKNDLKLGK